MIALAARGIRTSFGRRQVLTGLDFKVAAVELVAVAGEDGTGTRTLLRIPAPDLRPDTGTVAIGGTPGYRPRTVVLDEALTAWAMRAQYTCWAHRGASPQARARLSSGSGGTGSARRPDVTSPAACRTMTQD